MGGGRSNNEDNYFLNGLYKPLDCADYPMLLSETACGSAIIAVCDGMGGEAYGEYAAWCAVSVLAKRSKSFAIDNAMDELVNGCVREMNAEIWQKSKQRNCRMGSTIVLAIARGCEIDVYNIGDSRAYLFSKRGLVQLSQDHTAAQELIRMGINPPSTKRTHNQLTQHLGIDESELILEPYHSKTTLEKGDRLLLCSDGLTSMLDNNEIAMILSSSLSPEVQALRLTKNAENHGAKDNVTAIVLSCVLPEY